MSHEGRDYFSFDPAERQKEAKCFLSIYQDMPLVQQVHEVFGGIGLMMEVLKELGHSPKWHSTWDHSTRCIEELRRKWPKGAHIQVDSFGTPLPTMLMHPSLISADFNTFSPLRAVRDKKYGRLLDGIFQAQPDWVEITDSAVYRLHLNRPYYSQLFAQEITDVKAYLTATSRWFFLRYGYSIVRAAHHRGASYYLLTRTKPRKFAVEAI